MNNRDCFSFSWRLDIAVKLYHPLSMSILVGPVEAAELSLLPAGLVFDRAWMHLSSDFHFHNFKRKGDFTIDPNANVARKSKREVV